MINDDYVDKMCKCGDYKLAFSDPKSNWDIYINSNGTALSIAKKKGCKSSFYGDLTYIKRMIRLGYFKDDLINATEYGKLMLGGVHQ